ncbi:hypothetical protein C2R22_02430 [Salinigranum rubrum]|uniref:Uncharacterized protein n=1 Tax=Salinigranum rubrum TaxID=755307 RepID=A0A2I8VFH1_9EURY|nr:hypothetical protein [Salinigranum rubrum]AUV80651.1 hypothetical protein C2R22_02430 [Salinigranum rubrum]
MTANPFVVDVSMWLLSGSAATAVTFPLTGSLVAGVASVILLVDHTLVEDGLIDGQEVRG